MKKLLLALSVLILVTALFLTYLFSSEINLEKMNFVHCWASRNVFDSWDAYLSKIPKNQRAIVDFDTLMNQLNFYERNFAERIFAINPKEIGFKGPKYSKDKPGKLVKVESVKVGDRETGIQYCPENSYLDYLSMMQQMKNDIGKQLFIDSGYRSLEDKLIYFFTI